MRLVILAMALLLLTGSQDKWKAFNHMLMPSYGGQFTKDELKTLKEWMENLGAVSQAKRWKAKNAI